MLCGQELPGTIEAAHSTGSMEPNNNQENKKMPQPLVQRSIPSLLNSQEDTRVIDKEIRSTW